MALQPTPATKLLTGLGIRGTFYSASTDDESDPEDPTVAWCPPIPDAAEDPSEDEITSAADKLAILISNVQSNGNLFAYPKTLELSHRYGYGKIDVVFDCHPRKVCAHLAECGL